MRSQINRRERAGATRYSVIDAYTLEELRREYSSSDIRGRIRLLRTLSRSWQRPPFEIALMATEDPNAEVRAWLARYGQFRLYEMDRQSAREQLGGGGNTGPQLDPQERLKNDPDPFVRACLRENPKVSWGAGWSDFFGFKAFLDSTPLERLAAVRTQK